MTSGCTTNAVRGSIEAAKRYAPWFTPQVRNEVMARKGTQADLGYLGLKDNPDYQLDDTTRDRLIIVGQAVQIVLLFVEMFWPGAITVAFRR